MSTDVDKLFVSLGVWGKWQIRQMFWVMLTNFPISFQLLATVFIGYKPPFRCQLNITEPYDNYGSCELRNTIDNTTEKCMFGFDYDIPREASIVTQWDLVCDQDYLVKLAQTILVIGQAVGALGFTYIADRYGRKWVCIICQVAYFIITLSTAFAPNIEVFMALRFVMGALQQGVGMVAFIMAMELLPAKNRTALNLIGSLLWGLPVTLLTLVGFAFRNTSWRYQQLTLTSSSAIVIVHFIILEESVRWLYANGRTEEANKLIEKAADVNRVQMHALMGEAETATIENSSRDEEMHAFGASVPQRGSARREANVDHEKVNIIDLVKHPSLRKISLIMIYIWFVNSLIYYALFFTSSELAGNRFINYFLNAVVEFPAYIIGYFALFYLGRRLTCLIFHTIAGLALIISVILYQVKDEDLAGLQTALSIIGKFGISGSFSSVFFYTPELYPTNFRSIGIGLGSAAARFGSMISPFSALLMADLPWVLGLTCSLMLLVICGLLLLLPETGDKELPQTLVHVQEMCQEKLTFHTLFRRVDRRRVK